MEPGPGKRTLVHSGLEVGGPLGAGKYGLVFECGAGQVAKLSCRCDEARFATWLAARANAIHEGIARFQTAFALPFHQIEPQYWAYRPAWAIVRESLADIDDRRKAPFEAFLNRFQGVHHRPHLPSPTAMRATIATHAPASELCHQVANIVEWSRSENLDSIGDLKVDNFGLRGDVLVVRDYDYWSPPKSFTASIPDCTTWAGPTASHYIAGLPSEMGRFSPRLAEIDSLSKIGAVGASCEAVICFPEDVRDTRFELCLYLGRCLYRLANVCYKAGLRAACSPEQGTRVPIMLQRSRKGLRSPLGGQFDVGGATWRI